jgi:tetratricopeptide (TPR) repeat protein
LNRGDVAMEVGDMKLALQEYAMAEKLFPDNLEMKYWKAVTLANNKQLEEACSIFKEVFNADENWRELTKRLPKSGLLIVTEDELKKILNL